MAAAYLTISSYCCSISSQSIGLVRIGSKLESRVRMPAWGRASFWRATAFSRGASSNPRSRPNAKPPALWPWLSARSDEHTSELHTLMRTSDAVLGVKNKTDYIPKIDTTKTQEDL